MTVIQAYTSAAGFEKHGEWMAPKIPRLVPLLASPPDPPVLLRSVSVTGRRSFTDTEVDSYASGHRSLSGQWNSKKSTAQIAELSAFGQR